MPLQATSGTASYDAFGGGVPAAPPTYIEDVFSTYLWTGTGVARTITNNIDLSTYGGLVWFKCRGSAFDNELNDTVRGITKDLISNGNFPESTNSYVTSVNSSGFSISTSATVNQNNNTYASWTFRKQPKFFDVVTYTGNGVSGRQIPHNLGSTPGFVVVKNITSANSWYCWHRSVPGSGGFLETTDAFSPSLKYICGTVNSTVFSVDSAGASVNGSGDSYVAYLFAHDAGGFGLTGTDNVISCGSFTTDGSGNATVSLGYEPQWLMTKSSSAVGDWFLVDNMRGFTVAGQDDAILKPNLSNAETASGKYGITSTGFTMVGGGASATHIYIAIRRGPMKVPTTGTSVYNAIARTGTGANANVTGVGFSPDLVLSFDRNNNYGSLYPWRNRLTGNTQRLNSGSDAAEVTEATDGLTAFTMDGISVGADATNTKIINTSGVTYIQHFFKRAPSTFDLVCYTGTGSARTVSHNLGVAPELAIFKNRTSVVGTRNWIVCNKDLGGTNKYMYLNSTGAVLTAPNIWDAPTASVFSLSTYAEYNENTYPIVAYLFATCAGVSKVGSYTGTATTKQIDCGFTAGARYVLIKRTDSTGDWYVWDSTRGIVAGNDPYLLMNSWVAEVTNTDYIDTYSAGFEISSTAPAAINASGGTYIFLAIA